MLDFRRRGRDYSGISVIQQRLVPRLHSNILIIALVGQVFHLLNILHLLFNYGAIRMNLILPINQLLKRRIS